MANTRTACKECGTNIQKKEGVLIGNRYHCKDCAPAAKAAQDAKEQKQLEQAGVAAPEPKPVVNDECKGLAKKEAKPAEAAKNKMNMKPADRLDGMKAICQYVSRSESTIIRWSQLRDFPAKVVGHGWVSSKSAIDKWWETQAEK
jgi:predicted DNA-binding transcriptional regulator AlpA